MPTAFLRIVLSLCCLFVLSSSLVWGQVRQTGPSPGGIGRVDEENLPDTCLPGQHLVLVTDATEPSQALRICDATGTGYQSIAPPTSTGSSGLQVTQTDIRSTRHEITTLTASSTLGFQSSVCVEVGADGVTLTLPLAATAVVGDYFLEICDAGAGPLTLEPTGSDTLNYRPDSQVVTGQGSQLIVRLMSDTNWSVMSTLAGPTGGFMGTGQSNIYTAGEQNFANAGSLILPTSPGAGPVTAGRIAYNSVDETVMVGLNGVASGRLPTRLCHATGSSAHVSSAGSGSYAAHGLTCTIPANTLQSGDMIQACALTALVTGTTAPVYAQQLRAGTTVMAEVQTLTAPGNDVEQRSATWCWWTTILAAPGAAVDTWTGPTAGLNAGFTAGSGNNATQPVALATNGVLVWTIYDQWGTVGAGEDTATLKAFTVIRW